MTDPAGRLVDLARDTAKSCAEIISDPETSPLMARYAMELQREALKIATGFPGFTEMPDAKRERLAS